MKCPSTTSYKRGSSPLARGTSDNLNGIIDKIRLIPARAGNIEPKIAPLRYGTAHPRSRGEHKAVYKTPDGEIGSSPLARGTCDAGGGFFCNTRLIPARAGNMR